ncbi:Hypothetical_protein [Hexamita inflata]|uniref:Hypothetical_protein n=1 Tax=Hexamita inflata TaxID=28002 RepID=A0AA86TU76_9EUKA|nr:Hypothetical protein HINF_LOCUS16516 [Hexamita inflata]CAI9942858.1 Hypothetical protein HINF_LOCUS30503 [Hexamita inflata]
MAQLVQQKMQQPVFEISQESELKFLQNSQYNLRNTSHLLGIQIQNKKMRLQCNVYLVQGNIYKIQKQLISTMFNKLQEHELITNKLQAMRKLKILRLKQQIQHQKQVSVLKYKISILRHLYMKNIRMQLKYFKVQKLQNLTQDNDSQKHFQVKSTVNNMSNNTKVFNLFNSERPSIVLDYDKIQLITSDYTDLVKHLSLELSEQIISDEDSSILEETNNSEDVFNKQPEFLDIALIRQQRKQLVQKRIFNKHNLDMKMKIIYQVELKQFKVKQLFAKCKHMRAELRYQQLKKLNSQKQVQSRLILKLEDKRVTAQQFVLDLMSILQKRGVVVNKLQKVISVQREQNILNMIKIMNEQKQIEQYLNLINSQLMNKKKVQLMLQLKLLKLKKKQMMSE